MFVYSCVHLQFTCIHLLPPWLCTCVSFGNCQSAQQQAEGEENLLIGSGWCNTGHNKDRGPIYIIYIITHSDLFMSYCCIACNAFYVPGVENGDGLRARFYCCKRPKIIWCLSFPADLSGSHRGSTLSLVTEADSVLSGGAESQRWDFLCCVQVCWTISSQPVYPINAITWLTNNCVSQGWVCVLYGLISCAEQDLQPEHGQGLGECFHSFFHHFNGVHWWAEIQSVARADF